MAAYYFNRGSGSDGDQEAVEGQPFERFSLMVLWVLFETVFLNIHVAISRIILADLFLILLYLLKLFQREPLLMKVCNEGNFSDIFTTIPAKISTYCWI